MAPAFIDIKRARFVTLNYRYKDQQETQTVSGNVRWGESVLPNSLLWFVGPSGWALAIAGLGIDYALGNMWEINEPEVIKFKQEEFAPRIDRLIVTPVLAESQLESDEALRVVVEKLKAQYPKAVIETPEDHFKEFERSGWNFEREPKDAWKKYELFAALKATYVVSSRVMKMNEKDRKVLIDVEDPFRRKNLGTHFSQYKTVFESNKTSLWMKSKVVELIPNSLSLQHSNVNNVGYASQPNSSLGEANALPESKFEYTYYTLSGAADKTANRNEWGVSFANLEQDMGRRFSFVFKWATEATIRKSTVYVHKNFFSFDYKLLEPGTNGGIINSESVAAQINQYFLGGSIGPEVGLVGSLGYLYLNLLYGAEFLYADFSTSSASASEIYSPVKMGLGYKVAVTDNLQLGVEVLYRVFPEWVASKMLTEAVGQKIESGTAQELRTVLGLTYYLPEMKSFGRKQVRGLVTR